MVDKLDWNDLRYVVAVAREGSAAAAARAMGVSHATVMRRISALERAVGQSLFHRLATGYEPTEAGRTLLSAGELTAGAIVEARSMIEGRAAALSGTVQFTTTDSLAGFVVPGLLKSFAQRYPRIHVSMAVTNSALDLDRRDADVSLRASAQPPEHWVGLRAARMAFGVYVSKEALPHGVTTDWRDMDWLFPEGAIKAAPASQWLAQSVAPQRRVAGADSFVALKALARAQLGATLLPHFLACRDTELQCIHNAPDVASADIWVLTHPTLRHTARVSALMTHLAEGIREMRSDFEHGPPGAAAKATRARQR